MATAVNPVICSVLLAGAIGIGLPALATPAEAEAGTLAASASQPFACGGLTTKPVGQAEEASAQLGATKAALSGTAVKSKYGGGPLLGHPVVKVWEANKLAYSGPLDVPPADVVPPNGAVWPAGVSASLDALVPLCVARFGGPSPEDAVIVGTYSGGAHCCTFGDIYTMPSGRVATPPLVHDFGDPGVSVRQSASGSILVTADDAFAYEFDNFASSGLPIVVFQVRGTHLVNTTKHHVALVASNAKLYWKSYEQDQTPKNQGSGGGLGLLAAWVADECNLGRGASALATVDKLEAKGDLTGGSDATPAIWPTGAKYVKTLKAFLAKHNYSC